MACELTNGRLLDDCLVGRAGIKTLFFIPLSEWLANNIDPTKTEIVDADINLATGAFRFELADNVGNWEEVNTGSRENGTTFLTQTVVMTIFNIIATDLADLNNLRKGRWVILALDFQEQIRVLGSVRGCVATGGSETSGMASGDKKGLDLSFVGEEDLYAPFTEAYTSTPLDNFTNITVTPAY